MEFGLLGPLLVRCDGTAAAVSRGKERAVLAALLLRAGQVLLIDDIDEALWGSSPPPSAEMTVRNYVKRLRQVLGHSAASRIATRPGGYSIQVEAGELDVARFEQLAGAVQAAMRDNRWDQVSLQSRSALSLWRGDPLADVGSRVLAEREGPRLTEMRLQLLEARLEADARSGGHAEVIPELYRLVQLHPLREQLHATLMLALYRCGQQGSALIAYRNARRLLTRELGVEPGPGLRELHQRILTADPSLSSSPARPPKAAQAQLPVTPRQLPAATGTFTGRAAELNALSELPDPAGQSAGVVVVSAIAGMGGVGKTTLAVHWAHQAADKFPDGQLYIDLRGFDPSGKPVSAHSALHGVLTSLGIHADLIPAGRQARTALYRSVLAGTRMLILLDNARDEQQVRPLLPASPGCMVLVTSRNQMAGLAATEGAYLVNLDVLSHDEAIELLTARFGGNTDGAEPGAVSEIAALCGHLPLALSVAASRAATRPGFPLAALARELRDSTTRLDALDASDPAASMQAVFSWSYQQLSTDAARMFRLLGLHPGPDISVLAAASLAGADELHARSMLRELTSDSLITEHKPGRYALHDLLRAYAIRKARDEDSEPDRAAAAGRFLDHYLHTGYAAARLLSASAAPIGLAPLAPGTTPERLSGHRQAMAWFDAEEQVLLAAITPAGTARHDVHAWQFTSVLAPYFEQRGYWQDWIAVQETAREAAASLPGTAAHAIPSRILGRVSEYGQARAHLERSLRLHRQLGDRFGEARTHMNLCRLAEEETRYADALADARSALSLYRAGGCKPGEAGALNNVGWYSAHLRDYEQARLYCQRSIAVAAQLDDSGAIQANAWDSLGYAEQHAGNPATAVAHYQRAVSLYQQAGDHFREAVTLTHLAEAFQALGNHPRARQTWQQAQRIFTDLGHSAAATIHTKLKSLPVP